MPIAVLLFGYGSLLYDPELPEAVVDRFPARVHGMTRRFNKPSRPRGIRRDQADWHGPLPDLDADAFVLGPHYLSLALGTAPGPHLDGEVLVYRPDARAALLRRMHAREGIADPTRPGPQDHYRCVEVTAEARGRTVRALSWVSNPGGAWHVEGLTLAQEAAVLRRATPAEPQPKVRGARYLFGVEAGLAGLGLHDPYVSRLADAVRRLG